MFRPVLFSLNHTIGNEIDQKRNYITDYRNYSNYLAGKINSKYPMAKKLMSKNCLKRSRAKKLEKTIISKI